MKNKHLHTTRVIIADETVTELEEEAHMASPALTGIGTHQLVAHYNTIINSQAIFYPVAYRFLKELGRGRQGIVFLALRHGARGCITSHALKLFDPGIYSNVKKYWTDMGRLAHQVSRLQSIRSPNLVSRDIYLETNGIGYIQMELIEGLNLDDLLTGRHLEEVRQRSEPREWARFTDAVFRFEEGKISIQPGVALYILRQLLRGLESLHALGFLHSDIKPSNVMIDRLGYVKLVDFGRAVRAKEKISILLGSPLYMAPEIHRREPGLIQSDLYSIGLLGLQLLRGEPFIDPKGVSEEELLEFKMKLPERLPELLPEHVKQSEQIVYLLRRFLDPKPENRFPNAREAGSGKEGIQVVHKQLMLMGKDTEYGRELEHYLSKIDFSPNHPEASASRM